MMRDAAITFAIRPAMLLRAFGSMGMILAVLTLAPMAVALLDGEYAMAWRYGVVILVMTGLTLLGRRVRVSLQDIQTNEVFALAVLLFLGAPLLMAFPMAGVGVPYVDAFFEALSGATTTGLSTIPTLQDAPRPFLFSRAWMQWYGGLGIVVVSLALLTPPGGVAKRLAAVEDVGDDLWGGAKAYARRVVIAYGAITVAAIAALLLCGVGLFESLTLSLAAVSTGGFAPTDASLAALSAPGQWAVIAACVAGAAPLILYMPPYRTSRVRRLMRLEVVTMLGLAVLGAVAMTVCLRAFEDFGWSQALTVGPVMAFSAQTTAGFSSVELAPMHDATQAALLPGMLIGGCVGSTGGGVKVLRVLLFLGLLHTFLARINMPRRAVRPPRFLGEIIDSRAIQNALVLIMLYLLTALGSWMAFLAYGYPPMESLFDVCSAVGTVGLSAGVVDASLPTPLKLVLCLDMLMGRLEVLAVLVLLNPSSWLGRRATP